MSVEFYRDLHKNEFERQERLNTRGDAIVALFTTLCGLLGYMVLSFKAREIEATYWFWIFIAAAGVALAVSAGSLIAANMLPDLRDIDTASKWHAYKTELDAEYKTAKGAFDTPQQEFEDGLISIYVQATDFNAITNTRGGYRLKDSATGVFAAVFLLAGAFGAYYYASATDPVSEQSNKVAKMPSTKDSPVCVSAIGPNPSATRPGTRPVPGPRPPPKV